MTIRIGLTVAVTAAGTASIIVLDQPVGVVGVLAGVSALLTHLSQASARVSLLQDAGFPLYVVALAGAVGGSYAMTRGTTDSVVGGLMMLLAAGGLYLTGRQMSRHFGRFR